MNPTRLDTIRRAWQQTEEAKERQQIIDAVINAVDSLGQVKVKGSTVTLSAPVQQ